MSISSTISVDILVNGNTCKQYNHNGRTFIEAKNGSEYEIKVGNNFWNRVLVVSAVDGLNVLTGEPASEQDSGYVISRCDSLKIKGFRYSDEKVGAFKFTSKNNGYSSEKGEGQNVGVIGLRIFSEKFKPATYYNSINQYNQNPYWSTPSTGTPYQPYYNTITATSGNGILRSTALNAGNNCNATDNTMKVNYANLNSNLQNVSDNVMFNAYTAQEKKRGFDMETAWGTAKDSKVVDVEFDKGDLISSFDIFYASRESLLEMGVPLLNETKVSFPTSFPKKYATPPKNWKT